MIIGIDLGTTFSVLAVSGRVELTEGYPPPIYLDQLDVTIIPDQYGSDLIPSAVWADPDEPDKLIVGTDARNRVTEGVAPILASKRDMGTDIRHRLLDREYTAREVATIILSHLKGIAEQALGERVDRAVITHPAFFEGSMLRETAEAARGAGFDFDQEQHLLMEPTAAAFAYTGADPRDPLRLLTYDLGGGTFDVTVLERRGGVATIRAFGGNRLLGGHTFDIRLATWLYQRMRERGIRITVDDVDRRRHATWIQLLEIAEDAKHRLAGARTDKAPEHIRGQLTDDDGRPVPLRDEITRAQYTDLIQDLLDETLEGRGGAAETKGCEMVIAEAGITIDQIDEILLVGGSTQGPWVADAIRRKFGREPRLLEPDRIVAAGAALKARSLPTEIRGTGCAIQLAVEGRAPQTSITVAGRVETETATDLALVLADDTGLRYVTAPDESGRFHFGDVELRPRMTTRFVLTVGEGEHRNLAEHRFEIEHVPEDAEDSGDVHGAVEVFTVLPKPLYIEKADGMERLAEEGAPLPAACRLEFQRTNDFDTIEIRLFQDDYPIGSVLIRDVPVEATRGSKVALTVEITRSMQIEGRATVHSRGGTVIREASVDINIPRMDIPSLAELEAELARLEADLEEDLEIEMDVTVRMYRRVEGDRLRRKTRLLLAAPVPDRQEVWLALRALDRIVHPPREELVPPLAHFESVLLHIRDVLATRGSDPNLQALARTANRLEKEGRTAHARREGRRWAQVNDSLVKLLGRITGPVQPDPEAAPPADVQKEYAIMQLDQIRQELRAKEAELMEREDFERLRSRTGRIRAAIDSLQDAIERVGDGTPPLAAAAQIRMLLNRIGGISTDIRLLDIDIV